MSKPLLFFARATWVSTRSNVVYRSCLNVPISGTKELASRTSNIAWRTRSATFVLCSCVPLTTLAVRDPQGTTDAVLPATYRCSCCRTLFDNTALSHPVRCKLRLHYARLYAGGIVDLQSKFARCSCLPFTAFRSSIGGKRTRFSRIRSIVWRTRSNTFVLCSCLLIDNTALSHPVRYKLRLHYARLYAGGIVDLQSKFAVAQHHTGLFWELP